MADEPPLCVDLDGTLVAADTLRLSAATAIRRAPWLLFVLPFVLVRGRPVLKRFLAARAIPEPSALPWRKDVVAFASQERRRGRQVWLVTAADRLVAESVASSAKLFDRVIATDLGENLKGRRKLSAIRHHLQGGAFDYVGDSEADLPVFAAARTAYLVGDDKRVRSLAARAGCRLSEIPRQHSPVDPT